MLQRIQTIYLLIATISLALLLVLPIYSLNGVVGGEEIAVPFYLYGFPTNIAVVILTLLPIAALMMYKKRPKQLMLTRVAFVFTLLYVLTLISVTLFGKSFLLENLVDLYGSTIQETNLSYEFGYYLPFISLPFLLLAIRGIRADEKLVKSLDRIR